MTDEHGSRGLFNELTTLLSWVGPSRLSTLQERFPQYASEIKRGPDAGKKVLDREYYESRAAFTVELCKEVVSAINVLASRTIERTASLSSSKLFIALLAAIGGATTLAAVGFEKGEVARISGIITSAVAILNAGLESLGKRYSSSVAEKATELVSAALRLSQLEQDLAALVRYRRDLKAIADAIDQCNKLAFELNLRKDQLRLV